MDFNKLSAVMSDDHLVVTEITKKEVLQSIFSMSDIMENISLSDIMENISLHSIRNKMFLCCNKSDNINRIYGVSLIVKNDKISDVIFQNHFIPENPELTFIEFYNDVSNNCDNRLVTVPNISVKHFSTINLN